MKLEKINPKIAKEIKPRASATVKDKFKELAVMTMRLSLV